MASYRKASEIAALLDLKPHPEGGYYMETFRDHTVTLSKSQLPHQYKVDRPVLELHDDGHFEFTVLGSDLEAGHRPQYTVLPNTWFGSFPTLDISSYSTDGSVLTKAPSRDPELHYSLVGCTCAPAFQFEDFELATKADMLLTFAPKAGPLLEYIVQPN